MPHKDPLKLVGTTIGEKYLVEEVVGEGGFSVVYRAQHVIWKQPVALKCFKLSSHVDAEQRQLLLNSFIQEGKLMTELSTRSSAIVQARDVGTHTHDDGTWIPYMVLEWLEGIPLDGLLDEELEQNRQPRSLQETIILMDTAAEALAVAHSRNIVHRDIKPANLFVVKSSKGQKAVVKVLDFGVAKTMAEHIEHSEALKQTTTQVTAFTPSYGAPEQFSRNNGATGPWTDVFAFALVCVEIMNGGRSALTGDDFLQLALASCSENRRPTPQTLGISLSNAAEDVFLKALAVRPADRFANMGEFWSALRSSVFPEQKTWTPEEISLQSSAIPKFSAEGLALTELGAPPISIAMSARSTADAGIESGQKPSTKGLSTGVIAAAVVGIGALGLLGFVAFRARGSEKEQQGAIANATAQAPAVSASAKPNLECPAGMAKIAAGKFFMGSDEPSYPLWKPAHKVQLESYCIDQFEVTAGEYKACSDVGECKRGKTESRWPRGEKEAEKAHEKAETAYGRLCNFGKEGFEKHPINCVTWEDAETFCRVKGKRLPTEAEWEYGSRGSDGRHFPWGDETPDNRHMNACGKECSEWEKVAGLPIGPRMYEVNDGYAGTSPVGSFPAGKTMNGLFDMVGNVFEWTADWMGPYEAGEIKSPSGPKEGEKRVIRGGAFNGGYTLWVNPAFRYAMVPTAHTHGIGFRCAKSM